jgi:hypothetical protein
MEDIEMKPDPSPFESTPEFQHFREAMRRVIAVPKAEMDKRVQASKDHSSRKDSPHSAGRKRAKKSA